MTQILILGATGHIGGAILKAAVFRFPGVRIVALVRQKSAKFQSVYPDVQTRIGSLQDVQLIESESRAADVVIYASPDGLPESPNAIKAALRGLASRPEKGHYIQLSGAYLIGEEVNGLTPTDRVWSDILDIDSITNMPADRYHSHTDQLVRDASADVNVAIVAPTVVYGISASTERRIPITIRDIIDTARTLDMGFTMSQGRNIIGYVHVEDLAEIFVRLLVDIIEGPISTSQLWGPQAYYFANSEEHTFAGYMAELVKVLKDRGAVKTETLRRVSPSEEAEELQVVKKISQIHAFGANVRCRGDRATSLLGLVPKAPGLIETLPQIVDMSLEVI